MIGYPDRSAASAKLAEAGLQPVRTRLPGEKRAVWSVGLASIHELIEARRPGRLIRQDHAPAFACRPISRPLLVEQVIKRALFAIEETTSPPTEIHATGLDPEHVEVTLRIHVVAYAARLTSEQAAPLGAALVCEHARDHGLGVVSGVRLTNRPGGQRHEGGCVDGTARK